MSIATLPEQLSAPAREFASREHGLLIGGEAVTAADGRRFETIDPASARPITTVAHAGAKDVDHAVGVAREALESGPWSKTPAADRALAINRLADLIDAAADELAELESLDNGKPVKLAKVVDVASTVA